MFFVRKYTIYLDFIRMIRDDRQIKEENIYTHTHRRKL